MTDRYPDRAQTRGTARRAQRAAQAAERLNPEHQHDWRFLAKWIDRCPGCGVRRAA